MRLLDPEKCQGYRICEFAVFNTAHAENLLEKMLLEP